MAHLAWGVHLAIWMVSRRNNFLFISQLFGHAQAGHVTRTKDQKKRKSAVRRRKNSILTVGVMIIVDASVTQSALEEALASNMQAGGGMASRMSTISQALRSKYL